MSEDSGANGASRHPRGSEDIHVTNSNPQENPDDVNSSTDSIRMNGKYPYSDPLSRGSIATSFGYSIKSPATRTYSVSPSPSSCSGHSHPSDTQETLPMAVDDSDIEYPSRVRTPDAGTEYDGEASSTTYHVRAPAPLEYPFKVAEFITDPKFPYGVHTPERGTPESRSTPLDDSEDIDTQVDRSD